MCGGAVVKSTGGGGNAQIPAAGIGAMILYHTWYRRYIRFTG